MKYPQKKTTRMGHVRKVAAGSLSLFTTPAKAISLPLSRHYARRISRRKGKAKWLFWLEVCLFLFAIGLFLTSASLEIQARFQTQDQPIAVSLESHVQKNGEPYAFAVTVKNTFEKTLTESSVSLHLPPHTTILTAPEHFSYDTLTLPLDRLVPGAERTMMFSAATLEDRDDQIKHALFVQFKGMRGDVEVSAVGKLALPSLSGDPVRIEAEAMTSSVSFVFTNTGAAFFSPFLFEVCPRETIATACVSGKIPFLAPSGIATTTVPLILEDGEKNVTVSLKTAVTERTAVFQKTDVNLEK